MVDADPVRNINSDYRGKRRNQREISNDHEEIITQGCLVGLVCPVGWQRGGLAGFSPYRCIQDLT